jgi:hypothetical protein
MPMTPRIAPSVCSSLADVTEIRMRVPLPETAHELCAGTHGALSGQVSGNGEPGLLLTPPDKATEAGCLRDRLSSRVVLAGRPAH